jgi:hypothetical protein
MKCRDHGACVACLLAPWLLTLQTANAQTSRLTSADPARATDSTVVLEDIEHRLVELAPKELPGNLYPGPPSLGENGVKHLFYSTGQAADPWVWLADPDQSLRECEYSLHQVTRADVGDVTVRLREICATPLYRLYQIKPLESLKGIPPGDQFLEQRCRYARSLDLKGGSFGTEAVGNAYFIGPQDDRRALIVPVSWVNLLAGEDLPKLWIECCISVDQEGHPTMPPKRLVRPVALQTTSSQYLVHETCRSSAGFDCRHGGGFYGVTFTHPAFRFTGESATKERVRRVMDVFREEAVAAFRATPIKAELTRDATIPPDELLLRRRYKKSLVLGLPTYEVSSYRIRWWIVVQEYADAPEVHVGYETATAARGGHDVEHGNQLLFVRVYNPLLVAVGAGTPADAFHPATPRQAAKYHADVEIAMEKAISATSQRLGGLVRNGVGVIPGS